MNDFDPPRAVVVNAVSMALANTTSATTSETWLTRRL